MLFLVICAAVLATEVAQQPLCCSIGEYETQMRILTATYNRTSGVATREMGFANYTYDLANRRTYFSYKGVTTDGVISSVTEILYYERNIGLEIVEGVCTPFQIVDPMISNCVPSDAQARDPTYLGAFGDHLWARSYVFAADNYRVAVLANQDCFPLNVRTSGSADNVDTLRDNSFFGATAGVSDPDVFTPPAACHQN